MSEAKVLDEVVDSSPEVLREQALRQVRSAATSAAKCSPISS